MKKELNIGFVILHYQAIKDTIEAVGSLCENIDTENFHIIIVDNASPNGTGNELLKKYQGFKKITVILNDINDGFARGNNCGYRYLKNHFNPHFIVLLNNDIIFTEKKFYEKLIKEYNYSQFHILGPMILTADGKYTSSPIRTSPLTKEEIQFAIDEYRKNLILNKLYIWPLYSFFKKIKNRYRVKNNCGFINMYRQENVQIHGCCLVFSKLFIENRDGLCDRTFLYCEEDILFLDALKSRYKIVYLPDIRVYHKEDVSTDCIYQATRKKNIFYYREALKSEIILLDIYNQVNTEENKNCEKSSINEKGRFN